MTRVRVEGLLAAFPKLVGSGKQHTYVETENVRYVYQPLECGTMYLLLVTTKGSNILEDLDVLRLLAKTLPEYTQGQVDEEGVSFAAFDLIFAFDEIISLGYKENVTMAQVKTFTEMNSHEEKLHKMMIQSKINDTKDVMRRKATEIDKVKEMDVVREAVERRDEIDIFVTSGTSRTAPCRHSMLHEFMGRCGALAGLEEAGAVGDMLWQPIGPEGAIEQTGRRAFTLVDLKELPGMIERGKWVVLVIGPCRRCNEPRGDLLRTILEMPSKYLSHLVVDSRSAAEIGSERPRSGSLQAAF